MDRSIWRQKPFRASRVLLFVVFLAVVSANITAVSSNLTEPAVSEYEVKAAYVYYFAKFIEWPQTALAQKNAPFIVGVVGDDEFGELLRRVVKDKTILEHPIQVRLAKWPGDLHACHILYVSYSDYKRFPQIAESLQQNPVLTITEVEDTSRGKGIINLFVEGGKVQFEVNITSAEKAQLKISSKLLRLARETEGFYSGKGE
jgi:hypothetical protein